VLAQSGAALTVTLLSLCLSSCSNEVDSVPAVEHYLGITIPDGHEVLVDTTHYLSDDSTKHIVLRLTPSGFDSLVSSIEASPLYGTEYSYSADAAGVMADRLLETGLTGYWVPTDLGYEFREPALIELPNSHLYDEWWMVEAQVSSKERTLDFLFRKI
jgi:hypothetical protein